MFLHLKPPPSVEAEKQREIDLVKRRFVTHKAKIGKTKRQALERKIRRQVEEWERATSGLRSKLASLSDFLEGKPESVDWPFGPQASSSIDVRLAAGYARLLRAQFVPAVFSDPAHTYISIDVPGVPRKILNMVEMAQNWTAENDCNLNEVLKDSIIPCYRDGTAILHGRWSRRIERGFDYKSYMSDQDFVTDYPDAETAGIEQQEYDQVLEYFRSSPEAVEVRVEFEVDFVSQNEPEYTLCPLAKFIWHPFYPSEIRKLGMYGFIYTESKSDFEYSAKYGYYDSDAVEACRRKSNSYNSPDTLNNWEARRMALEGISDQDTESVSYRLAWLCVRDDSGGATGYYGVTYDLDRNVCLRVEYYGLPRNTPCMIPLRLIRRDGRLLGASMLKDGEHLFREVNALHRHRSNQRRISDSVTLLIPDGLKNSPSFDLGAEYLGFRPGLPMYVPDQYMNPALRPAQLVITSTSRTSESVDEESFLQRYMDLMLGSSQGQSGRESPVDPNAPASKTAMLLSRADLRTEDLIDEWRRTIPDIADLHRALYQQNADSELKIVTRKGEELDTQKIPISIFADPSVRIVLKPMKPAISPEVESQKYSALAVAAMKFMLPIRMNPKILITAWNDFVAALRIERPERYQIDIGDDGGMMMGGAPADPNVLNATLQQLMSQNSGEAPVKPGEPAKPGNAGKNGAGGGTDLTTLLNSLGGKL